jgi:uncharacterized OsmC-like protein
MSNDRVVDIGRSNGLDVEALGALVGGIEADSSKGIAEFRACTRWKGQTLSETTIESFALGKRNISRRFTVAIDEPYELLGDNSAPNPQEMLMAALNACMIVGYVACATVAGIKLELVEIESSGELDLRGFLGLDPTVRPGYETIRYGVKVKGDGTKEQFQGIHETVMRTSPNYFNLSQPIRLVASLTVEN